MPTILIGRYEVKKTSIISDILAFPPINTFAIDTTVSDTVCNSQANATLPFIADTLLRSQGGTYYYYNDSNRRIAYIPTINKDGVVEIEDYSLNNDLMTPFYASLSPQNLAQQQVRIAFMGDSFIEGDIITADLRDTLQAIFGGAGVGFVPITSPTAQFRRTIYHQYENWDYYSLLTPPKYLTLGIAGYVHLPSHESTVTYKAVAKKRFLDKYTTVRLFYAQDTLNEITYDINGKEPASYQLTKTGAIAELSYHAENIKSLSLSFPNQPRKLRIYGMSFENGNGLYLDNFAVRGCTGPKVSKIPLNNLQKFDSLLNYKLIFLQYGLNVVDTNTGHFAWYKPEMVKMVNHVRKAFPDAAIVLVGVADRSSNQNGEFHTIPAIPQLINLQREIAQETGIGFWNLFDAMGGIDAMVRMHDVQPKPLTSRDYTHLTHEGGKYVAEKLLKTLLYEKQKYERKLN